MNKTETIQIHGIASSMQGVGRLQDGRAVFVPGAIPGETVEIEITKEAERFANARLIRVLESSSQRCMPACSHAGKCGGCAAQHMSYDETLRQKAVIVCDALKRIGGQEDVQVQPTIGMEEPWHYRNKMEYAVMRDGRLGFSVAGSHEILPAVECPLAEEPAAAVAKVVEKWLQTAGSESRLRWVVVRTTKRGEVMLVLSGDRVAKPETLLPLLPAFVKSVQHCRLQKRPSHALDGDTRLLFGKASLEEELAGMQFSLSAQSFFQINRQQCEKLLATAVEKATQGQKGALAADVYCGVGTLSLAMAKSPAIGRVLGFEIVPQAIADATCNARKNNLSDKTRFFVGDAAVTLPREIHGRELCTAIIDPPRKGVAPEVLQALVKANAQAICYVSCNPATLARDVAALSPSYRLTWVQPIDMFPWTEHVETVCLLSRNK